MHMWKGEHFQSPGLVQSLQSNIIVDVNATLDHWHDHLVLVVESKVTAKYFQIKRSTNYLRCDKKKMSFTWTPTV